MSSQPFYIISAKITFSCNIKNVLVSYKELKLHLKLSSYLYPRWCNINRVKLPNIKCFTYVFPCDFAKTNNEVEIYGTGGMILQNMKNLLHCLPGLERLELVDLQLDGGDGEHVLDEVSEVCYLSLKSLKIVNITRTPLSMMTVSSFANLRCLIISPHNLGDDLVERMGRCCFFIFLNLSNAV